VADKAVGEDVEVEVGAAMGVKAHLGRRAGEPFDFPNELTVTNDQARPVAYEARFSRGVASADKAVVTKDERSTWRVTIPANGTVTLRFR
jgi:hypothetical protein